MSCRLLIAITDFQTNPKPFVWRQFKNNFFYTFEVFTFDPILYEPVRGDQLNYPTVNLSLQWPNPSVKLL
jgi:hypothetical protein